MDTFRALRTEPVRRILGRVEVETIIKKMQGKKLSQPEKNYLSRSVRPKLIGARILCQENILQDINKEAKKDSDLIEFNLSKYGYPLFHKGKKAKKIKLEELIALILTKHPDARYIEAIPFLMIKNKVDKLRLLETASREGIKNKIGYLLETAMSLKRLPELEELLEYLRKNKDDSLEFLVEGDRDFLEKTTPLRVRRWNLLGRFFDADFERLAEVYL
jgi:hypothetical protein